MPQELARVIMEDLKKYLPYHQRKKLAPIFLEYCEYAIRAARQEERDKVLLSLTKAIEEYND